MKRRPQFTIGTKMMHGSHNSTDGMPVEEQRTTGAEEKENENKSGSDQGPIQDLLGILVWSDQRLTEVICTSVQLRKRIHLPH